MPNVLLCKSAQLVYQNLTQKNTALYRGLFSDAALHLKKRNTNIKVITRPIPYFFCVSLKMYGLSHPDSVATSAMGIQHFSLI